MKSSFRDKRNRQQQEEENELNELRQEVFNLPDNIERGLLGKYIFFLKRIIIILYIEQPEPDEDNGNNKENVTERLAAARQAKFNHLWNELLEKISQIKSSI